MGNTLAPPPAMAAPTPTLRPVRERERIDAVDTIRGVAVLGILLMNIVAMGLPQPAYGDPSGWGGQTGWNLRAWLINSLFFEGTMRGMFSILFGAGVLLFTGKDDEKALGVSVADAYYRRTIWLFIFGLVDGYIFLWPGDILYAYGLMGLFLFPLRHLKAGQLLGMGMTLLLAGAITYFAGNVFALREYAKATAAQQAMARKETLSKEQQKAIDTWKERAEKWQPDMDTRREVVAKMQGGYFSAMKQAAVDTYFWQGEGHYRYNYFDILSMMMIGMALLKWRVLHAERSFRMYGLMVLIGYGIGLPVNCYESFTYINQQFSVVVAYRTGITYDVGRLAMTAGHIGLIMLLCKSGLLTGLRRRLAAAGRMALTNYLTQNLIGAAVFVLLAQFGKWERHQLYYLVFGVWLFQLTISPIWTKHFYFGPAEWLWRSLTYLRIQPFRRAELLA